MTDGENEGDDCDEVICVYYEVNQEGSEQNEWSDIFMSDPATMTCVGQPGLAMALPNGEQSSDRLVWVEEKKLPNIKNIFFIFPYRRPSIVCMIHQYQTTPMLLLGTSELFHKRH